MTPARVWYPIAFQDRHARPYRVSFLIAEEATWDHRYHDLDGREIAVDVLKLLPTDHRFIQASCDHAVGSQRLRLTLPAANANGNVQSDPVDAVAAPA